MIKRWGLEMKVSKDDFWVLCSLLCTCCTLRRSLVWRPTLNTRVLELGGRVLAKGSVLREAVLKNRSRMAWVCVASRHLHVTMLHICLPKTGDPVTAQTYTLSANN